MSYNPTYTNAGLALLIKAMSGESLTFTKLQIGNGRLAAGESLKELTALINPVMDISIKKTVRNENNVLIIGNEYTNSNQEQDIAWNELGVYARGNDNIERLVAVMNSDNDLEYILSNNSGVPIENKLAVSLIISQSVNVSAVVKSIQNCTLEDLENHANTRNAHGMTAEDIGLGKVANEYFSDNIVNFDTGQPLSNITSGSSLKAIISKVWAVIDGFISHIQASNPHNITVDKINAASKSHSHSASSADITGILPQSKGGTGYSSIASLFSAVASTNATIIDYKWNTSSSEIYGYVKFSNGFLIQWESDSLKAGAKESIEWETGWTVPFKSTPIVLCELITGIPLQRVAGITKSTTTQIGVNYTNNSTASNTNRFCVVAFGKWK